MKKYGLHSLQAAPKAFFLFNFSSVSLLTQIRNPVQFPYSIKPLLSYLNKSLILFRKLFSSGFILSLATSAKLRSTAF